MNWRVTAALFVILLLLAGVVYYQNQQEPEAEPTQTFATPPPRLIPDVSADAVQRLDLRRSADDFSVTFTRDSNGDWFRTVPTATMVVSQTMNNRTTSLVNISSDETLDPGENGLSVYGLDNPGHEIVLVATRDDASVRFTFQVGDETPTGDGYYILKQGDLRIHVVSKVTISNILDLVDEPPLVVTPTPS